MNQPKQPVLLSNTALPSNTDSPSRPYWQSGLVIVLALLFLWPVGLYLMWKNTNWRKWVKVTLTIISLAGPITYFLLLTFIWGAYFGLKTYSYVTNTLNPPKINATNLYICQPIDNQWGKCVYKKDNISFEYPLNWNYIESDNGSQRDLEFNPLATFKPTDMIIGVEVVDFGTQQSASQVVLNPMDSVNQKKITVNGLNATLTDAYLGNRYKLWGDIQHGTIIYSFNTFADNIKSQNIQLTDNQLKDDFYHMFNSFKEVK